jgi:hypothetical protein
MYKRLNLTNYTAIYQPGSWESQYADIQEFCSSRGNGTFCFRPQSQAQDSCMDMAVVRCPEGILASCRSDYVCVDTAYNKTCPYVRWRLHSGPGNAQGGDQGGQGADDMGGDNESGFMESSLAECKALSDALVLPPGQNLTTTTNSQNQTITVGSQVFGHPFVTTTVDCTVTCVSSLPSGFPTLTAPTTLCFNSNIDYEQLIPKSTCIGPYPPGPMTTVCPSSSATESLSSKIVVPGATDSSSSYSTASASSSDQACSVSSEVSSSSMSEGCPVPTSTSSSSSSSSSSCPPSSPTAGSERANVGYNYGPDDGYGYNDSGPYDDSNDSYGDRSPYY